MTTDEATVPVRLLLVDDDDVDRLAVTAAISATDPAIEVTEATDATNALSLLQQGVFDCVLADLVMPGRDGSWLLERVRASEIDLPFIMLTGKGDEETAVEIMKAGATDYIPKSVASGGSLSQSVRQAIRVHESERELDRTNKALAESEERLRLALAEARRLEKLARERAEFERQIVGIVSHDLKNPISAMIMAAESRLHPGDLDARTSRVLARIVSSGKRAERMIQDLLDFTRVRIGGGIQIQRRPSDLHAIASDAVEELLVSFPGRHIDLQTTGNGFGEWDPDRVAQILTNLLSNALAYSPSASSVRLSVTGGDSQVAVEVHNDGSPIPRDVMANLFEPFKRRAAETSGRSPGLGLGLFIVRELAAAHGGTVVVTSSEAEGTTFVVNLPRMTPP
jgi:signal transduction histidine kinase